MSSDGPVVIPSVFSSGNFMDMARGISNEQQQIDRNRAMQEALMNRSNTQDAYGSINWSYDPTTSQWTQRTTLNPEQQALLDQRNQISLQSGNQVGELQRQFGAMAPMDMQGLPALNHGAAERQRIEDRLYNEYQGDIRERQDREFNELNTFLQNQGFDPMSQGYRTSLDDFRGDYGDQYRKARTQAMAQGLQEQQGQFNMSLQRRNQALQEMLTPRNQLLKEIGALSGGVAGAVNPIAAQQTSVDFGDTDFAGIAGNLINQEAETMRENARIANQYALTQDEIAARKYAVDKQAAAARSGRVSVDERMQMSSFNDLNAFRVSTGLAPLTLGQYQEYVNSGLSYDDWERRLR